MRWSWAETASRVAGGVAEGAWIALYSAVVAAGTHESSALDAPAAVVSAALVGVVAARLLPVSRWRPIALLVAVVGVCTIAAIVSGMGAGSSTPLYSVLVVILIGLATVRGAIHGDPSASPDAIERLVRIAPVLLGAGWVVGLLAAGPSRATFMSSALVTTLLFVAAGSIAMGSSRLADRAADAQLPRRGRDAIGILLAVVAIVMCVGLVTAAAVGEPIANGLAQAILGAILGLAVLIVGIATGVGALVGSILDALLGSPPPAALPAPSAPPPGSPIGTPTGEPHAGTFDFNLWWVPVLLATISLATWFLANRRQGRPAAEPRLPPIAETRSLRIDLAGSIPSLGLPRHLRASLAPKGAHDAYPFLVDAWRAEPGRARGTAETPSAHAKRLREAGAGDLGFDLLVADFEITRFAGSPVSAREDARAVARWRRLRRVGTSRRVPAP